MLSPSELFSQFSWPVLFLSSISLTLIILYLNKQRIEQLSQQNRLLRALRSLDVVALSTTEVKLLCQKIVDVINQELGYTFAVIALVDYEEKTINRVAISLDPSRHEQLAKLTSVPFHQQVVYFSDKRNLFNKVVSEGKVHYTDNLYDIQIGVLPEEDSRSIQREFELKTIIAHPLVIREKVVGILEYASTVKKENITELEQSIMTQFTAEVSRALDNAFLYQDLKATSEMLTRANERLKELDALKDDFVSIASHELRTPMTAIRSYSWMALYRPDIPLSEKMKKYLSRTLISTERLINLVNDMLNISRIESGRVEVLPRAFDIRTLVRDVMIEVEVKASEKKLDIRILESNIPKVFADPDKVHQVLLNLMGNAMKFTPNNGQISVSFFTDGKIVQTSVKDSGVGIAKEDLGRLFTKFGRLDSSYVAAATSGGTGLGLYISKKLIDLMKGKISVSSEGENKGATFSFILPIASEEVVKEAEKYTKRVTGEAKTLEPVAI
jgi:signal transduction histidine kinase